jgi:hypothetical protein
MGVKMKKTITIGGQEIQIRGLTWGEKAQLKADGFNLSYIDPRADNDEMVEKVISIVLEPDFDFTALESSEVYSLFAEIHKLTFLSGKESKN